MANTILPQRGGKAEEGKKFAIWGTKNGQEDIIRINGAEVQHNLAAAKDIKAILERRGDFEKVRIQTLDMENFDLKSAFIGGIKHTRGWHKQSELHADAARKGQLRKHGYE